MNQVRVVVVLALVVMASALVAGCAEAPRPSSDQAQQTQQELLLQEGTAQVGMPAVKNFRERKLMRDIIELRDQEGLTTYSYAENMVPTVIHGHTALGGKFTYLGETISFPIPYATQITNPSKIERDLGEPNVMPQAEPNGLFSPEAAEGTWIMMYDPATKKAMPQYMEPRLACFTFKLPMD